MSQETTALSRTRPTIETAAGAPFPTGPGLYFWHPDVAGQRGEQQLLVTIWEGMPFVAVCTIPGELDGLREIVWKTAPASGTWYRVNC